MKKRGLALASLAVSVMIACNAEDPVEDGVPAIRTTPTYHADVKPILQRHCVACHATAEIERKIVLSSYESASTVHDLVAHAVAERRMPPFGADHGGTCGTFTDARWLKDEEIQILQSWSASGAPEGDRASSSPNAEGYPAAARVEPTLRLTTGAFLPTYDHGVVRCFVVDPALSEDRFLTALRVQSNRGPWSVQQATLYSLDSPEAEAAAAELEARDPTPGYDCIAGTLVAPATLLTGWTWGVPTFRLPDGTGLRLRAGRKLVVQVHYNTVLASPEPDVSEIGLELAQGAVREATMLRIGGGELDLRSADPLGTQLIDVESAPIITPGEVLGIYPRMRLFGSSLRLENVTGDARDCMLWMPRWDFHGKQRLFVYAEPRAVEAGQTLRVTCTYSNSGRERPLKSGDADDDEECTAYAYVVQR